MRTRALQIVAAFVLLMLGFLVFTYLKIGRVDPEMARLAGSLQKELAAAKAEGVPASFHDFYRAGDPNSGKALFDRALGGTSGTVRAFFSNPHYAPRSAQLYTEERKIIDQFLPAARAKYFGAAVAGFTDGPSFNGASLAEAKGLAMGLSHLGRYAFQVGDARAGLDYTRSGLAMCSAIEADGLQDAANMGYTALSHNEGLLAQCCFLYVSDQATIQALEKALDDACKPFDVMRYVSGVAVSEFALWERGLQENIKKMGPTTTAPIDGVDSVKVKNKLYVPANRARLVAVLREAAAAVRAAGPDPLAQAEAADKVVAAARASGGDYDRGQTMAFDSKEVALQVRMRAFTYQVTKLCIAVSKDYHRTRKLPTSLAQYGKLANDPLTDKPFQYAVFKDSFVVAAPDVPKAVLAEGYQPFTFSDSYTYARVYPAFVFTVSVAADFTGP